MRIKRVEVWSVTMPLREPYAIAYENVAQATNVFLRLELDRGPDAVGCAAPDLEVSGEDPDQTFRALNDAAGSLLVGADPLRHAQVMEPVRAALEAFPSARAAIDMALFDALGKAAGLPLWRLLGGYRNRISTSVTIGILSESDTVEAALDLVRRGFRCIKLKGGLDGDSDAERVLAVRSAVGPSIELRFDANQGFTVEQSLRFVETARRAELVLIEQPTASHRLDALGQVTAQTRIAVMADESLRNLRDAFRLTRRELVDMVNVKIMKVGGVAEAIRINAVARAAGVEVMIGCMDEAALGIAAGMHLALSDSNIVYADLDGHLDLVGDPTAGSLHIEAGQLVASELPGLGIALP